MKERGGPNRQGPLWKALALAIGATGVPALLLAWLSAIDPEFSPRTMAWIAAFLASIGVLSHIWGWMSGSKLAEAGKGFSISSIFFMLGVRSWGAVFTGSWFLGVTLFGLLLLALGWALPALSPGLSSLLFREQITPQTRLGQTIMKWVLSVGGAAGAIGAGLGMFLSRTGQLSWAYFIIAMAMTVLAVLVAHATSQRAFGERRLRIERT